MPSSMQDAARTTLAINDNMVGISVEVAYANDALTGTRGATKILMR